MPSLRRLAVLAVILVVYIFQVVRVHPAVFFGQFQDDSIYFSTAKALADGHGYSLISFPGSPPPNNGRSKIYGLELPDPVLEKVYHLNAERVFAEFKGMPEKGERKP